ncbi:hypothetical protein C8J56DRAFT_955763 [Mycena floridula]|nr:hypothetical protein C8J56DRAFT_955763 [Mycena floridula]
MSLVLLEKARQALQRAVRSQHHKTIVKSLSPVKNLMNSAPDPKTRDLLGQLLRNSIRPLYIQYPSETLNYSVAVFDVIVSQTENASPAEIKVWDLVLNSLVSGVADFLEACSESDSSSHKISVATAFYSRLCDRYFDPSVAVDSALRCTVYILMSDTMVSQTSNQKSLRQMLHNKPLGKLLSQTREILPLEALVECLGHMAPLIPEHRTTFTEKLFDKSLFGRLPELATLIKGKVGDWTNKLPEILAKIDIGFPQPFRDAKIRICDVDMGHISCLYVDANGLTANIDQNDAIETMSIPFSILNITDPPSSKQTAYYFTLREMPCVNKIPVAVPSTKSMASGICMEVELKDFDREHFRKAMESRTLFASKLRKVSVVKVPLTFDSSHASTNGTQQEKLDKYQSQFGPTSPLLPVSSASKTNALPTSGSDSEDHSSTKSRRKMKKAPAARVIHSDEEPDDIVSDGASSDPVLVSTDKKDRDGLTVQFDIPAQGSVPEDAKRKRNPESDLSNTGGRSSKRLRGLETDPKPANSAKPSSPVPRKPMQTTKKYGRKGRTSSPVPSDEYDVIPTAPKNAQNSKVEMGEGRISAMMKNKNGKKAPPAENPPTKAVKSTKKTRAAVKVEESDIEDEPSGERNRTRRSARVANATKPKIQPINSSAKAAPDKSLKNKSKEKPSSEVAVRSVKPKKAPWEDLHLKTDTKVEAEKKEAIAHAVILGNETQMDIEEAQSSIHDDSVIGSSPLSDHSTFDKNPAPQYIDYTMPLKLGTPTSALEQEDVAMLDLDDQVFPDMNMQVDPMDSPPEVPMDDIMEIRTLPSMVDIIETRTLPSMDDIIENFTSPTPVIQEIPVALPVRPSSSQIPLATIQSPKTFIEQQSFSLKQSTTVESRPGSTSSPVESPRMHNPAISVSKKTQSDRRSSVAADIAPPKEMIAQIPIKLDIIHPVTVLKTSTPPSVPSKRYLRPLTPSKHHPLSKQHHTALDASTPLNRAPQEREVSRPFVAQRHVPVFSDHIISSPPLRESTPNGLNRRRPSPARPSKLDRSHVNSVFAESPLALRQSPKRQSYTRPLRSQRGRSSFEDDDDDDDEVSRPPKDLEQYLRAINERILQTILTRCENVKVDVQLGARSLMREAAANLQELHKSIVANMTAFREIGEEYQAYNHKTLDGFNNMVDASENLTKHLTGVIQQHDRCSLSKKFPKAFPPIPAVILNGGKGF